MKTYKLILITLSILIFILLISFKIGYYFNDNLLIEPDKTSIPVINKNEPESVKKLPTENSNTNIATNPTSPNNVNIPTNSIVYSPEKIKLVWDIIKNNVSSNKYSSGYDISFPYGSQYSNIQGVTCFRGNNFRNSASFGFADVKTSKLEKVWQVKIGFIDSWTGVGWNGQPAIVKWGEKVKSNMNIFAKKKTNENFKEVIYAALDGKIYFLDLDDGSASRNPIDIGFPLKGSVTVDPRGYPLLYSGQGLDEADGKTGKIGYRIFSLIDQSVLYFINGYDPHAYRYWGAFDSTALIDKYTDTFIECGENGILYTGKLNTKYDENKGTISINPQLAKYRYKSPKNSTIGTENSVAIYNNFAYFVDNSGVLQCIDLNTLTPIWIRDVTDDTDSTIAIDKISDSEVYLYTACEVDQQGDKGFSYVRKINAFTGEFIWEKPYECLFDSNTNGGALASPIVGKKDIDNLVIYNIAKVGSKNGGKLIAFDKKTGKEVWVTDFNNYSWSSPVDVYTKSGKAYIVFCDSAGYMYLLDGKTGIILDKTFIEANVEGSPAVFDDMIVVGTRGQKIWGIKIK